MVRRPGIDETAVARYRVRRRFQLCRMLVLSSYRQIAAAALLQRPRVVVIGNFDGVHQGHKALLGRARALATSLGGDRGSVVVLTFSPHPARVLAPHLAPPLLSSGQRKRLDQGFQANIFFSQALMV